MQKDKLTLNNIKKDLLSAESVKIYDEADWRIASIFIMLMASAVFIFALKLIFIGIIPLIVAAYNLIRFLMAKKKFKTRKKEISDIVERCDISISVEKLSHLHQYSERTPGLSSHHNTREVYELYFISGISWRIPMFTLLYEWSKDYHISPVGMKNISVPGNEYYFITLQGHSDIAYVYPLDFFELDESLKRRQGGN